MEFQSWHLVVLAVLAALVVWGFRASPQPMLVGSAVTLLIISGFLLYTLVLEEAHLDRDLNGQVDTAAWVAIPAAVGVGLGALAVKRARNRRA